MLRVSATVLAAIIGIALSSVFADTPSSMAHEHRAVGNYEFVVGWQNEPALAYEPNGLHLGITFFPNGVPEEESEEAEAEGQPVEGLEETLQAEIIAGGGAQTRELPLEPAFGEEGVYESPLIPTVPGDYTFRILGDLEGQQIDESFASGPETFSVIEDTAELQFPEQLPSNADLQTELDSLKNGDSSAARSSDDTARALAVIGIIVGVLGLGAGGLAVASRRS
jgi:hypothetical protein